MADALRLPTIRSERLTIDHLTLDDVDAFVAMRNDERVGVFQSWAVPYTTADAERLISESAEASIRDGVQLAVRRDGAFVGDVHVSPASGASHAFELGITITPDCHGRGYATEAIRALTDALFALDEVGKLIAYVAVSNAPSQRVFDRVGFRREGALRHSYPLRSGVITDEVLYGLTRAEWSIPDGAVEVVAFDADDTLWKSEDSFDAAERMFVEIVSPYVDDGVDVKAALTAVERKNLPVFGYGVKAFGLSMVECATTLGASRIPAPVVGRLIEMARAMLAEPVQLLPDVASVLEQVGATHRIVLITKGDLIHQTAKIEASGLAHHFEQIEIVMEKDSATYARIIRALNVPPERFCMVGNSVRSDILPVLALGASAVHVPYPLLWDLEQAPQDHGHTFAELESLAQLPQWLRESTTAATG